MADKYLCTKLFNELIDIPNGKARLLINGATLKEFLPLILSVPSLSNKLENLSSFILLRYTNNKQMIDVFKTMLGNSVATQSFINMLQNFLAIYVHSFTKSFSQNVSLRFWDF